MPLTDDLFKKPALPVHKRKLEPIRDPNELHKSPRLQDTGSARSNASHQPSVTNRDDQDNEEMEAGPELPPDFDEDALGGDEEGRFFGSGISEQTANAISYLDANDGNEFASEEINVSWLRKTALNFEKKINKNAELRAKFEGDPRKFMGSEADLDAEIKSLSLLSEHPELYPEFARLGCTTSLAGLLAHENTDIAIDAIEIIGELIDEDVQADDNQWSTLVDGFIDADLLGLLHSNLGRLDEEQAEDRSGVYNILAVLESLASRSTLATQIGQNKEFFSWLLDRVRRKESKISRNRQYATEICAILLQNSVVCRASFVELDGVDTFLQLLSVYRKKDPERGMEEEEYMENLFECLTCALDEKLGKVKFLEAEGIELCLIMLREGKVSKPRAIRLLDHALAGPDGRSSCEALIEAAGLKPLFATFMKKQEGQSYEHILGIFASMLRSLPADSAPRIRLLAKFVEKDYQKLVRLVDLLREYSTRLRRTNADIDEEKTILKAEEQEEIEAEWLSRRLDAGLSSIQTIFVILAWIAAEDDGGHNKIATFVDLGDIKSSLHDQADEADEAGKEMLIALAKAI